MWRKPQMPKESTRVCYPFVTPRAFFASQIERRLRLLGARHSSARFRLSFNIMGAQGEVRTQADLTVRALWRLRSPVGRLARNSGIVTVTLNECHIHYPATFPAESNCFARFDSGGMSSNEPQQAHAYFLLVTRQIS